MAEKKSTHRKAGPKERSKGAAPLIRSSTAEYLSFVAAAGSSQSSVEMRYEDENIWLSQKLMATLYDVSVSAINQHLKRFFADNELEQGAVIKHYLITAADGKNYPTNHYNQQAIIAVGFKSEEEKITNPMWPLQRTISRLLN